MYPSPVTEAANRMQYVPAYRNPGLSLDVVLALAVRQVGTAKTASDASKAFRSPSQITIVYLFGVFVFLLPHRHTPPCAEHLL